MPPYRYKQQLKRYILQHGDPDPLTRHLILHGTMVNEPLKALEPFVGHWEETVSWLKKDSELPGAACMDEYGFDLLARSDLQEMIELATEEQLAPYRERIEQTDQLFRSITRECSEPFWPDCLRGSRYDYWWLFRIPK